MNIPKILLVSNFVIIREKCITLSEIQGLEMVNKFDKNYVRITCKILESDIEQYKGKITNLFLNITYTWKLSRLFEAVGLKEKGKDYETEWDKLIGKKVFCVYDDKGNVNFYNEEDLKNE